MEMSAPKDGLLLCPLCGARRFYTGEKEGEVTFSVDVSGRACDILPAGTGLQLSETTLMHCVFCSWRGTVGELAGKRGG